MKDKKYLILFGISLMIISMLSIFSVNAISCMSDINCPEQGNSICQSNNSHRYTESWSCINGECKSNINSVVDCCTNNDCAKDQVCDTKSGTCKGGSPYYGCTSDADCNGLHCDFSTHQCGEMPPPIIGHESDTGNSKNYNNLIIIIILALAIIIGFILLGLIIKKRK